MADATHRITVARDAGPVRQTLWTLAVIMATAIPCAVGLAVVGGYLLAGHMLAPVGALADTARKITAESLSARLPVANPADEFGRLAAVFNETLARLDAAFEQLRRFTADASHELRTPLRRESAARAQVDVCNLVQPDSHTHLAVHRGRGSQMLSSLLQPGHV
jgi:signal transduction histidine kinase